MGASEIPCAPSPFVQRAGSRERDDGDVLSLRDGQPGTVGMEGDRGRGDVADAEACGLDGYAHFGPLRNEAPGSRVEQSRVADERDHVVTTGQEQDARFGVGDRVAVEPPSFGHRPHTEVASRKRGSGGGLPALVVEVAEGGQASGSTSGCVNRTGLPSDRA